MSVIERIVEIIEDRGISQKELCENTNIKRQTFSTWKNRNSNISLDEASAIADYLNVSLTYLSTGKGSPEIQQLTEQEEELLRIFKSLNIKDKTSLLSRAYELEEQK